MRVVWISATPRLAATGAPVTVFLAGGGADTPYFRNNIHYRAGVVAEPRFKAELGFDENGWNGGTVPTTGNLIFKPSDKALLTTLSGYVWKGASITIERGPEGGPYATILNGTVDDALIQDDALAFIIADLSAALNKPLLTARFTGTGGIEGIAEAANRLKRRSLGAVFNVEARILDKANNIYEVGDPAIPSQAIPAVRDKGRAAAPACALLAWQGSIAATFAALQAAACVQGSGVVAPSINCVKWWTQPAGPLTADLLGEIGTGYVQTAAEIAARIAAAAGGPAVANAPAMAVARPGTAGIHIADESETASQAIDRLLLGVSLLWILEPAGTIRIREWSFANPVETLVARKVQRRRSLAPIKTRRLGFQRGYRTHNDGEIAAIVRLADVSGLGALAELDQAPWATAISGRPAELVDGRIVSGLTEAGDLARDITAERRDSSSLLGRDGGGVFTGELAADVTATHVASSISGQGALATSSAASWATQVTGRPAELTDGRVALALDDSGDLKRNITSIRANGSNLLRRTAGGLFIGELEADVTATHIASSIAGQGALATLSAAAWGSHIVDRPLELVDGRVALALDDSGDLKRNITTARRNASNLLGRTGGGSFVGELAADITATHTAAGIVGQGALATLSSVGSAQIAIGAITGSKMGRGDTSNILPDSDLADTAAWNGPAFTLIPAPSGAGYASKNYLRLSASASQTGVSSLPFPVEGGAPYRLSVIIAAGFGDQLAWTGFLWYSDPAGTVMISETIVGHKVHSVYNNPGSRNQQTVTAPTGAMAGRIHFTRGAGGDGAVDFAEPIVRRAASYDLLTSDAVRLGGNVRRFNGTTLVNDADAITTLGTAAAISGQGALATKSAVAYGTADVSGFGALAGRAAIKAGATTATHAGLWDETQNYMLGNSSIITNQGTASGIAGQGALATKSQISLIYDTYHYLRLGTAAGQLGDENLNFTLTNANTITSYGTASSITGQGALATASAVDFESGSVTNKTRTSKLTAATGVAVNSSILPANVLYSTLPSLNESVAISDTDNGGTVTINVGSAVYYPDSGGTVTFPAGGIPGCAYGTKYYLKRVGVNPVTAPTGTGWNASTVLSIGVGDVLINPSNYTTRASAAAPSPPPPQPREADCVAAEAWVETQGRGFVKAREIIAGDMLRVLTADRTGTRWEACTSNHIARSEAVRIATESGFTLTCSVTTPITLLDGSNVFAAGAGGHSLPIFDGQLRWSRCEVFPAGEIDVAHIRCSQATYAAGDEPGRAILTHNPFKA